MAKFAYGLASIKAGGIDAVTGLPTSPADVGDVVRDSGQYQEADGEVIEHYAELKEDPVVSINRKGLKTFNFELMDTSAANLVVWCGGTNTQVEDEPDVWNEPETVPNIEKSLQITTEDGTVFEIRRAKIIAKKALSATVRGRMVIQVTAKVLQPKVDAVAAITVTDPAAPED